MSKLCLFSSSSKYSTLLRENNPYKDFGDYTKEVIFETDPLKISKNTYHIMALHFLVFRILNKIYAKKAEEVFSFPMIGSEKLWFIYFLCGIAIPIIFIWIINIAKGVKTYDNIINSNISQ